MKTQLLEQNNNNALKYESVPIKLADSKELLERAYQDEINQITSSALHAKQRRRIARNHANGLEDPVVSKTFPVQIEVK